MYTSAVSPELAKYNSKYYDRRPENKLKVRTELRTVTGTQQCTEKLFAPKVMCAALSVVGGEVCDVRSSSAHGHGECVLSSRMFT